MKGFLGALLLLNLLHAGEARNLNIQVQDLLSFDVKGDRYSFSKQTTYNKVLDTPLKTCMLIYHNQALLSKLCASAGTNLDVAYKFPYLTLESGGYERDGIYYTYYTTLKLVGKTFYLHQFSQQSFKSRGDKHPTRTWIFYRQPRDDPQRKHLMTLKDLKAGFYEKMEAQCYQKGYCVDASTHDLHIQIQNLLSFDVDGKHYNFSKEIVYQNTPDKPSSVCVGIQRNQEHLPELCGKGKNATMDLVYKFPYLTIEQGHYDNDFYYKTYFTYKLLQGNFYLHQYSQQAFNSKEEKHPVRTWIFYRQPRDDPQREHPIALGDLKFDQLKEQCYQRGDCVD
ncbi:hypothetical protein [Helicobacter sp. L8]|uniref:hypothetical protein n=1 Tax=Helicobacter sp. L8 TaxID=2316078 RepID=UPI000EB29931|nr:hypothetical protein [Helicobacter sp. L8]